jgi:hypothetical protein
VSDVLNRMMLIEHRNGELLRSELRVCMESYFREFFLEAATKKSGSRSDQFKVAIKLIVWGGIYLESLVNLHSVRLLRKVCTDPRHGLEIWSAVERTATHEKLSLLGRLAGRSGFAIDAAVRHLRRVMDLRNRLAHFKDSPMPVDPDLIGAMDGTNGLEQFAKAPETDIEITLSATVMRRVEAAVLWLDKWVGRLGMGKRGHHSVGPVH